MTGKTDQVAGGTGAPLIEVGGVLGGDAACFMGSVCLSCGRVVEGELAAGAPCPHCGEALDGSRAAEC